MSATAEKIREDLVHLVSEGNDLLRAFHGFLDKGAADLVFSRRYEAWYSGALAATRILLPSRHVDFVGYYKDEKRKSLDVVTYCISDFLIGLGPVSDVFGKAPYNTAAIAFKKFSQQLNILAATLDNVGRSIANMEQLVQADLFDSEIAAAGELLRKGFLRPAGTLAGVVFEKHLAQVCKNHAVTLSKKEPTLADLNEALKSASVVDTPVWRSIQGLADLRNLCSHNKSREPTKEEVASLIDGVKQKMKLIS